MSPLTASSPGADASASPNDNVDDGDDGMASAEDEGEAEGDGDGDGDGEDEGDGSRRRRKRAKTGSRPMSVSCELCKQRKVKCDRGQPHCGWCVRNGQTCEYKERKKPGLRAGYGRELEARLDRLEGVLGDQQHLIDRLAAHLAGAGGRSGANGQLVGHPQTQDGFFLPDPNVYHHSSTRAASRYHEVPTARVGGGVRQQRDTHAPRSPIASTHALSSHLESPGLGLPNNTAGGTGHDGAMTAVSQDHDFPPYDLLYSLADLFFKHINTWCPILHRRTTLDALFGPTTLEEADRILLHAIVATTLRFSADPRLTEHARECYHSTSKQKVLLYGLEHSSIRALQAMVILALDIVGNSNGPPGWNLLALITRSVVQLGLAVETTSASVAPLYPSIYTLRAMVLPEPQSFIEDESRRRLFWMVYLLDRYATIATAFEFALDDREIDRKLPCRDDLFSRNRPVDTRWFRTADRVDYSMNRPENLGSFSYYIEIVGILSQIHRFLKKPVDIAALSDVEQWQQEYRELDGKLNAWEFSLPSEYGNMNRLFDPNGGNKIVNCIWIMLHVTYHTTVIRLHSSAAYPTTRSPIFTPSFAASQRCNAAVADICALCGHVRGNNMLTKLGPPFAFSLWVAARLLLVHGSTIDHRVSPSIGPLVDTLREMGYYWRVAERYATLLQRVLDEYHDSERAPVEAGAVRETPSTVRILADMRRCAYDLDLLISRQPRQYFGSGGGGGGGGIGVGVGAVRPPAATPVRTPAPNELEYLDVFDFFNMPRLPLPSAGETGAAVGPEESYASHAMDAAVPANSEFNITNFMYDVNADWLGNAGGECK